MLTISCGFSCLMFLFTVALPHPQSRALSLAESAVAVHYQLRIHVSYDPLHCSSDVLAE